MSYNEIYAGGLELNFFKSAELEKPVPDSSKNSAIVGRNVLRILMMGWPENWQEILSFQVFKAVLVERDHQLTKGMRLAFQEGFHYLFNQLKDSNLSPLELEQAQLYLSNCLTLLPFADITPYESFAIPQFINGQWQLVDYKVVPVELTPTTGFKKLFISDEDRVFAYGLEPINNDDATPHLIFMGTTYPAGQGFTSQINTDLESFETVGKKLYRTGRESIIRWLDSQRKPAHVCGTSLGGSLSLLLAIDQGDKLERVDALNPAGLYNAWRKSKYDHWDELTKKPKVVVQKQKGDPVSKFGVWKPDWTIVEVTPPEDKKGPNSLTDHALNYAGFKDTEFRTVDPLQDNEERKKRDFWLYTISRSLVYYFGLVPYRYALLPIARYVMNHKLQLAIGITFLVLCCIFPPLTVSVTLPFLTATLLIAAQALMTAMIASYLLTNFIQFIRDQFTHKKDSDISKFADWFDNLSLVTKFSLAVGVTAFTVGMFFILPFVSLFSPVVFLAVASVPLLVKIAFELISLVKTLWGLNTVNEPKCHSPELERNETMDIYQNATTAEFTYSEIGDYYYAKRRLLNDKNLLPDSKTSGAEKFNGLSKYQVIKNSDDPEKSNKAIVVTASKAKIYDMKQTVGLINRLGLNSQHGSWAKNETLTQELEEVQANYLKGKPLKL